MSKKPVFTLKDIDNYSVFQLYKSNEFYGLRIGESKIDEKINIDKKDIKKIFLNNKQILVVKESSWTYFFNLKYLGYIVEAKGINFQAFLKHYGVLSFHPLKISENSIDYFYQKMSNYSLTYKTIYRPHLSNDIILLFANSFSYTEDTNFKMLTISVFDNSYQFKAPLSLLADIKRNYLINNL